MEAADIWEIPVLSTLFYYKPKTVLKMSLKIYLGSDISSLKNNAQAPPGH